MVKDTIKYTITYEHVKNLVSIAAEMVKSSTWKPDVIVGLTRGGLVPAVMFSHELNVPLSVFDISLLDKKTLSLPVETLIMRLTNKRVLVVDDINDTGDTIRIVRNYMAGIDCKFYCIVNNIRSGEVINIHSIAIDKKKENIWVVFPWEKDV